jgi:signal transduction histidine kinase
MAMGTSMQHDPSSFAFRRAALSIAVATVLGAGAHGAACARLPDANGRPTQLPASRLIDLDARGPAERTALIAVAGPETPRPEMPAPQSTDAGKLRVAESQPLPSVNGRPRVRPVIGRAGWSEPVKEYEEPIFSSWGSGPLRLSASAAVILLVLTGAGLFRTRRVALQGAARLHERTAERIRIARELHDSILQDFQAQMLWLQVVRSLLPARPAEAIRLLEQVLSAADDAIAAVREAVLDLRSPKPIFADPLQALTALADEFAPHSPGTAFLVSERGKSIALDVVIADEIYRIAREAVRNAFRHARAKQVEAEISYGSALFVLRIRDDGVGLPPDVVGHGERVGHWGLRGMRERAACFGGRLEVRGTLAGGTEVELSIHGTTAYAGRGGSAFSASIDRGMSRLRNLHDGLRRMATR